MIIKGTDTAKHRAFLLLGVLFATILFLFYLNLKAKPLLYLVAGIPPLIIASKSGFQYKIQLTSDTISLQRYFYRLRLFEYKFPFHSYTSNNLNWIKFYRDSEDLMLEVDNGLENGTLTLFLNNEVLAEIGEKNGGTTIITPLIKGLERSKRNADQS